MPMNKNKTPASVAARDCSNGLAAFCRDIESTLIQVGIEVQPHRVSLWALAWAMSAAIVRNAGFNTSESSTLRELMEAELKARWSGGESDRTLIDAALQTSSVPYSQVKEQWSQVRTASSFAEIFVASLGASDDVSAQLRAMIAPMCAHRLVSEIYRLTDLQNRRAIQWAVMATIVTLCQFSSGSGLDDSATASVDKQSMNAQTNPSSPTRS